jgi:hypothetical protein
MQRDKKWTHPTPSKVGQVEAIAAAVLIGTIPGGQAANVAPLKELPSGTPKLSEKILRGESRIERPVPVPQFHYDRNPPRGEEKKSIRGR